jgi:error-prone DNA polymerase
VVLVEDLARAWLADEGLDIALMVELGLFDYVPPPGDPLLVSPRVAQTARGLGGVLDILGLDASRHVMTRYASFLESLGVTPSRDLLARRSRSELLVAGVKVATQTPPIRSGRRVVFLTVDDGTGPVDATFFEDVQGRCAATVFSSWLLLVRGELRRTGRRGVSLRATGAWELSALHDLWRAAPSVEEGVAAVRAELARVPGGVDRPVPEGGPGTASTPERRRVLVHSSGFRMSPYSDIRPAGENTREVARKLWHRSPGSPG